jgi:hypothetical protein
MILTEDNTTWIESISDEEGAIYENTDGKRWRVSGSCNQCGLCEIYNNEPLNQEIVHTNYRMNEGVKETHTRVLIWHHPPGTPGACVEVGYNTRLDIPMTPELINRIPECTYQAEWL